MRCGEERIWALGTLDKVGILCIVLACNTLDIYTVKKIYEITKLSLYEIIIIVKS